MAVTIKVERFIEDVEGKTVKIGPDPKVAESTDIEIVCDGPRCDRNPGGRFKIGFNIEATRDAKQLPPDSFFKCIGVIVDQTDVNKKFVFCSKACVKDYLEYVYIPPLSPRELAEQQTRNQQVAAAKPAHTVVKFPTPDSQATSDVEAPSQPCD